MVNLLFIEQLQKHVPAKGRPPKLSLEDQVVLCLSYWREYWTLFHIATSCWVSEPTTSRIVRHVEDCLIRSNLFNLPKDLPEGEGIDWNVMIVDATEIPIQRPKKNRRKAIAVRKSPTPSNYRPWFTTKLSKYWVYVAVAMQCMISSCSNAILSRFLFGLLSLQIKAIKEFIHCIRIAYCY